MKKSLVLTLLAMILCFSMSLQVVQAAQIVEPKQSELENSLVQPRAILHVTKTVWVENDTIKVAFNYSKHDTGDFVGIQNAYIAQYSGALYRKVEVTSFGKKPNPISMVYAKIRYQYVNSNEWHYAEAMVQV